MYNIKLLENNGSNYLALIVISNYSEEMRFVLFPLRLSYTDILT